MGDCGTKDERLPVTLDGIKDLMDRAAKNGGDIFKALAETPVPSAAKE